MSGRTKEELARKKAQEQNAKAKKKKTAQKKKAEGKSLGLSLPMVERKLPTLSKQDQKSALERVTANRKRQENPTVSKKETVEKRYNPLIKAPTRMTADTSPEIDNLAEATVRKMAQGFEGALVGYSDRRNMKRAEDYLSGEYNNRVNPFTRTGMRMKVDDPAQVAKAKAEAERMGYKDLDRYEKAKANELIHANDDFYQRKAVLDKRVELENYQGIKKYIPEVAEQVGSLIPTMAVGAVSGGIGSAAGLTGGAAWALNTLLTGGEIGGRVSGQEAREVYNALANETMNREQMLDAIRKANTTGELVGIAEAGTEALFGGLPLLGRGLIDNAARKVGWEVLSPATKASIEAWRNTTSGRILTTVAERTNGAIGEGVEEAVMTLAQPAIENRVAGLENEVTLSDIIHDFGMGAAVSLVLGVPVSVAETADAVGTAINSLDAKAEILSAFETRTKEMVEAGLATPEEAQAKVQEIRDVLNGKGSLRVNDVSREVKTTSDTKEVYGTVQEAQKALQEKAKGKEAGEEVSVGVVENGVAETWTARVTENGIEQMQLGTTTAEDRQAYTDKAQRMANAKTPTERSGIQHNVKEEIVQEVSELSNVLGKEVEFFSAKANVHGYVEDGKIYVNANSSQSPAAAVIAHEMTHLLEGTKGYNDVVRMIWDNYGSSLQAKKDEIRDNYKAAGKDLNETDLEYELVAMFVEEKLLTDSDTIRQLATKDRTVVQKVIDWINNLIQKITGTKEQRVLLDARKKWMAALGENKKAPESGADKRFSIYETESGEKYVVLDKHQGLFVGKDESEYPGIVTDFLYEELKDTRIPISKYQDVIVNKTGIGKNVHPGKYEPQYAAKLKASVELEEILQASEYIGGAPDNKDHEFAKDGFHYYKTIFIVDGKVFECQIDIGINADIGATFYVIHKVKNITSSNYGEYLRHLLRSDSSVSTKSDITDIITDSSEKGKQTFSIGPSKDAVYMEAVNHGDMAEAQRMVDEAAKAAGYSERLFHQTDAEFSVFDPRHKGAGSRDNETPYGIFMKKTPGDIGLKGKNQMQLYAKLENPLVVQNRYELRKTLENMSSAYRAISDEIENLNSDYSEKYESAKNAFRNYRIEWRKNNPDASRNDLYKDEYFQKLFDAEDNVVDEWEEEASKLDAKAKEIITNAITDAGYDGIILQEDKGSFGRSTDAYIALEPSQVKSADPVTYDDEGNVIPLSQRFNEESDDIRWSIGKDDIVDKDLRDLIKTENRKMREVFYSRSVPDREVLWGMIEDEEKHIAETGSYRYNVVQDIIDFAYETGYRYINEEMEPVNSLGKVSISVPERYRGEMDTLGGIAEVNRELWGSGIAFTYKKKGGSLDDAYRTLQVENQGVMPETTDPSEQVQAIVDNFGTGGNIQSLKELDDEAWEDFGQEDRPFYTDIENKVYEVMEELSAIARANMIDSERAAAEKALKDAKKAVRKAENQRDFSRKEKEELKQKSKADKKKYKAELNRRAKEAEAERKAQQKHLSEIAKEYERGNAEKARELVEEEQKRIDSMYRKTDKELRKERSDAVVREYFKQQKKPEQGTAQAVWLKNNNVKAITEQFRRETLQQLVYNGRFQVTNENVVVDENQQEVAVRKDDMWDFSEEKNTYTPYFGSTLLAKKEGIDVDQFFTMYAKIKDIQTRPKTDFKSSSRKEEVTSYINSLNLKKSQKEFLYYDVARYAKSTMPIFLDGGRVNEEKGNIRGRMLEALDNISMDMFKGHMKEDSAWATAESPQIRQKDINDFVDLVYGEENSTEKDYFLDVFTRMIVDYSEQMEAARMAETSNLLIDNPKQTDPLKTRIIRSYREAKQNFLCEGEAFERMADKLNSPLIKARYYQAKSAVAVANEMINGKHQRNLSGELVGKSLYQIFEPIFKADTKAKNSNGVKLLTELVNNRHDIYRLQNDKGYTGHTIEECEVIVENISAAHPEILKVADELVEYGRNLLKMCVDCGRISQEDFDYFTAKYPYYVPVFRVEENEALDRGGKNRRDMDVVHRSRKGNRDVLPLWDQMVRRTNEIVKACKKNQLAYELVNATRKKGHEEYVSSVTKTIDQGNSETAAAELGKIEDIGRPRRTQEDDTFIPWYCNGEKFDVDIADSSLLYGWDRINYRMDERQYQKILRRMNSFRRAVLTQYNPTFWLTNHIRDISDLFLYNQHAHRLPGYLVEAYGEMFGGKVGGTKAFQKAYKKATGKDYVYDETKKADSLERYLSKGASQASIFEYDNTNAGRKTPKGKVISVAKKPLEVFDTWNFMFEQIPRLAVFNETVDRLSKERDDHKNDYTDEEIESIAAYQAADATLNFGRSGTAVKNLNTYGCTFLNAGVQGMDRARRMFTQVKDGNKKTVFLNLFGLVFKIFAMGFSAHIIIDWLYGGDDEEAKAVRDFLYGENADEVQQEFMEMSDYQRMNYILVNIGGEWIRIPQGRLAALMYSFGYNGEKVYSGEIDALDLVEAQWDMAKETVLFGNPVTNNVFGPIIDASLRNKDAWGNDIVSEYEDMGEGFHYLEYDEDTTQAAIKAAQFGHWLTADVFGKENSRILDFSPKKLDYVIKQYFGSYANILMPFMDGTTGWKEKISEGLADTLIKKFYIDPVESNRLAGDYYDLREEIENVSNAHDGDSPYAVVVKLFNDYNDMIKPIREQITEISKDPELSAEDRAKKVLSLREDMNQLYRNAVADAKDLLSFATENYTGKDDNSAIYDDWVKLTKDAGWRTASFNKTEMEKYNKLVSAGLDSETALQVMDRIDALEPVEGKTSVSEFQKVKVIADMGLTKEQEIAAMSYALNSAAYAKFTSTTDYGVTAKVWADYKLAVQAADYANNNNGSYDGDEKKAALNSMDISNETRAALWQINDNQLGKADKTASWKAGRNPFSPSVGVAVVEKYMAKKEESDEKEEAESYDTESLAPVSLDTIVSPVSGVGTVTSGWGPRDTGIPGASKYHRAVDIAAKEGTAIGAALSGVVTSVSKSDSGYGNSIEITSKDEYGNTIIAKYSHLSGIGVELNQPITQGAQIGKMGNTGTSSGSHLDFKLSINGEWVDPEQYVDFTAAGVVDTKGYTDKTGVAKSGGTSAVVASGGGSSGGGSSKKSYTTTGGNKVAAVTSNRTTNTGSAGTSGGSSNGGGLSLPQASSRPAVTGRSVDSPTYGTMGLTLPRANANRPTPTISTSVATTQRTGRTGGSLWDPDVLS